MRASRNFFISCSVFLLSTTHAQAVQISLSSDSIDRYFRILEHYVLPLMVVSTVVLFCGYLASRIYHRTTSRRDLRGAKARGQEESPDEGTEAFLRELKTRPPIEEPEPRREPRLRGQHPLLRRRSATATRADADSAPRAGAEEEAPKPGPTPPAETPVAPPATDAPHTIASAAPSPAPAQALQADKADAPQRKPIPRLQAAFRRRRPAADGAGSARRSHAAPAAERHHPPAPAEKPAARDVASESGSSTAEPGRAERPNLVAQLRRQGPKAAPPREDPASVAPDPAPDPVPSAADNAAVPPEPAEWWEDDTRRERTEPTVSVVAAARKENPAVTRAEAAAARAVASEVIDSFDYVASVLQQGSVLLGEKVKSKQGMALDEVQSLRVIGVDQPRNLLEDLRKLGGDAAEEVLNGYAAVDSLNKVVQRLEQMAESEPLDEGWNDLVRARVSDTIFAVGQVRKTLGIYRKKSDNSAALGTEPKRPDGAAEGGAGDTIPAGRRRI